MFKTTKLNSGPYGIKASDVDMSGLKDHKIPEQLRDEIPTLNQYGYMKFEYDEFTKEFVELGKKASLPILEIGTAYGWVVHRALEQGIKIVASDVSHAHLEVLLKNAPKDKLDNLFIYPGAFPGEIDFDTESLSSVLCSRVFHFLTGDQVDQGLDKIHSWLIPGGKFYFSTCSMHHYAVRDTIIPIYKQKRDAGIQWPGEITNHKQVSPAHAPYIHDFFHVFDIPQLEELLDSKGFKVEKIKYYDYPSDHNSDGIGHIGFVATKI